MKEMEFKIDQALCDMIEERQYELDGLKNLLGFAWSTTEYQIPQEKIKELQDRFNLVNKEYNILKEQITNMIPDDYNRENTSWNLDFKDCIVHVTEK